jgi:uncharacterized membrane protein
MPEVQNQLQVRPVWMNNKVRRTRATMDQAQHNRQNRNIKISFILAKMNTAARIAIAGNQAIL